MQTGENSIIEARILYHSNSYTSLWRYGWIQQLIPLLYQDSSI